MQHGPGASVMALAEAVIAQGVTDGQLRPIPVRRFLRLLASSIIGYWVTRSMIAPGDCDDAAEIDAMAKTLAQGLRP